MNEDLLKEKLERLELVPDGFADSVSKAQREIMDDVLSMMNQLEVDGVGNLVQSEGNLLKLETIKSELSEVLYGSDYIEAVRDFATEIDAQGQLNSEFFADAFAYEESSVLSSILKAKKKNTMSLLLGGAMDSEFINPVVTTLEESISSGAGFKDTIKAIRIVVEGGEVNGSFVQGKLLRYTKQLSKDAFSIYDRTYNKQVGDELDVQFYRYTGGTIGDTRKFCRKRNGKFWHKKEVEGWARSRWDGKHRSTNKKTIFTLVGGYNCNHALIPVSLFAVPKKDVRRNVKNGNLKTSPEVQKALGEN